MYTADNNYNALNEGLSDVFEAVAIRLKSSPAFVFNLREGFKGNFDKDTTVVVRAITDKLAAEFTVTVKTFSANLVEPACRKYEANGGILSTAKQNGTVFVGDSYFTEGYWKEFYTDFECEDAYLLGIAGSVVDEWFMCSECLLYPLDPSEIIVHI